MNKSTWFKNGREMVANDAPGSFDALTKAGWSQTKPESRKEPVEVVESASFNDAIEEIEALRENSTLQMGINSNLTDRISEQIDENAKLSEALRLEAGVNNDLSDRNEKLAIQVAELTASLEKAQKPSKKSGK